MYANVAKPCDEHEGNKSETSLVGASFFTFASPAIVAEPCDVHEGNKYDPSVVGAPVSKFASPAIVSEPRVEHDGNKYESLHARPDSMLMLASSTRLGLSIVGPDPMFMLAPSTRLGLSSVGPDPCVVGASVSESEFECLSTIIAEPCAVHEGNLTKSCVVGASVSKFASTAIVSEPCVEHSGNKSEACAVGASVSAFECLSAIVAKPCDEHEGNKHVSCDVGASVSQSACLSTIAAEPCDVHVCNRLAPSQWSRRLLCSVFLAWHKRTFADCDSDSDAQTVCPFKTPPAPCERPRWSDFDDDDDPLWQYWNPIECSAEMFTERLKITSYGQGVWSRPLRGN